VYLGNQPVSGQNNAFRLLDSIVTFTQTFDGSDSAVVSTADDTIGIYGHRFVTGQRVTYNDGGGSAIGNLPNGVYFIIKNDQNTIKLAANAADAAAGTAIDLTAVGSGASHTLNVAFDSVNTKFKATHTNGTKAGVTRAAQLMISVNGVIQEPQDSTTPTAGFGISHDSTIIFSTAPAATDTFFGSIVANNFPTFDISDNTVDSFTGDNVTTDFTLSKSPANNQNVLVTLDGVVQYPSDATTTKAYSVTENVISFSSAPGLGVAIQVRHIGFAGATSSAVTGFYGRTGNVTFKDTDSLTVSNIVASSGLSTFSDLVVTGDLTVQGTTTTLDSLVTEVDKLEVAANNTNVAVAVTQSGTGDILNLFDGSTEVFTVLDGGNVGFGITNPTSKLHVDGTALITGVSTFSSNVSIADSIIHTGDTDTSIRFPAADTFTVETGGSERLRITSDGKIGIGEDDPDGNFLLIRAASTVGTTKGHIMLTGDSAIVGQGPQIVFSESGSGSSYAGAYIGHEREGTNSVGNLVFATREDGGDENTVPTERLRITSSGNVGIGTDNPDRLLHLGSTGAPVIKISDYDTGVPAPSYAEMSFNGGNMVFSADAENVSGATRVAFEIDGSEKLRITSSGNIGIGTNDPFNATGYKSITLAGSTGGAIAFREGATTRWEIYGDNSNGIRFYDRTNTTERLRINSSGNLGINKTPETDWNGAYRALEIGNSSVSAYQGGTYPSIELNMNCRGTSASYIAGWKYISAGKRASQIQMPYSGEIEFKHAAVGANAGDAITWVRSARFTNTGNLEFPNGQGIDFSATSDGSGTTTSELLDDYEEGTWTPTDNSAGLTLSVADGRYVKVGSLVHCWGRVKYPSTSDTSSNSIGGFPFTNLWTNPVNYSGNITITNWGSANILPMVENNQIQFRDYSNTTFNNSQLSGKFIYFEFDLRT